jgi:hypothetical protein
VGCHLQGMMPDTHLRGGFRAVTAELSRMVSVSGT